MSDSALSDHASFSEEQEHPHHGPEWGYSDIYNAHVRSFFDLTYEQDAQLRNDAQPRKAALRPSKVTLTRSFYQPRGPAAEIPDGDNAASDEGQSHPGNAGHSENLAFEQVPGTLWTAAEKEGFFNCLARYTIHRVEEFGRHLPDKSEAEILAYYTLLKDELRQLKTCKEVQISPKPVMFPMRVFGKGISYGNIPIAHEVDDEWLQYEEEQSKMLASNTHMGVTKEVSKQCRVLESYGAETAEPQCLVDVVVANDIASLYQTMGAGASGGSRQECRLEFDSTVFLEELARLRTRQIMGFLVLSKGIDGVDSSGSEGLCVPTEKDFRNVSEKDVWHAAKDLQFLDYKTWGADGKSPLWSFWQHLQDTPHYLAPEEPPTRFHSLKRLKKSDSLVTDTFLRPITEEPEYSTYSDSLIERNANSIEEVSDTEREDTDNDASTTETAEDVDAEQHRPKSPPLTSSKTSQPSPVDFENLEIDSPFHRKRTLEEMEFEDWLISVETQILNTEDNLSDQRAQYEISRLLRNIPLGKPPNYSCGKYDDLVALWEKTFA